MIQLYYIKSRILGAGRSLLATLHRLRTGLNWIGWAGLGMAIALSLVLTPVALSSAPQTEIRGVWLTNVDSDVLFSRSSLNQAVRRLQRLHFNTLYPTVWNWGYTLYPSKVAQRDIGRSLYPHPGLSDRDLLAELVQQGHRRGLSVIPWVEFGLMAPAGSELVHRHPDWVTQRSDGSQIILEGGVHPRVWLNPAHPGVQRFLVDLVTELVSQYDIDGIQFDDHLGMPVELGYDEYSLGLYRQTHEGADPPTDIHDPAWMRWRADQVTNLAEQIFYAVKAVRPDCLMALSPNPREFAYDMYLQDWWNWTQRGFVEELIVQLYRSDMDRFREELDQPEIEQAHIPLGVGILTGLRNRPVEMDLIAEQVQTVRDRHLAGVSFFFYESLGDRDRQFRRLFPDPVPRQELALGSE